MRLNRFGLSLIVLAFFSGLANSPAFSQSGQAIFQDDRQIEMDNQAQANQLKQQEEQYANQVQSNDAKYQPYELYAEKRIQELEKWKAAGGSPTRSYAKQTGELYALENWLKQDAATKTAEQAHIKQLDQTIANLRQSTQAQQSNLVSDVQAMRENQIAKASDDRFNHMMQINQFNELQSEMGACSWGRPPEDGTFNSTGGYGMGGGYGYSPFMGRRW